MANYNSKDPEKSRGGNSNAGNFKNDPQRAAEAGRKGGEARGGKSR